MMTRLICVSVISSHVINRSLGMPRPIFSLIILLRVHYDALYVMNYI